MPILDMRHGNKSIEKQMQNILKKKTKSALTKYCTRFRFYANLYWFILWSVYLWLKKKKKLHIEWTESMIKIAIISPTSKTNEYWFCTPIESHKVILSLSHQELMWIYCTLSPGLWFLASASNRLSSSVSSVSSLTHSTKKVLLTTKLSLVWSLI